MNQPNDIAKCDGKPTSEEIEKAQAMATAINIILKTKHIMRAFQINTTSKTGEGMMSEIESHLSTITKERDEFKESTVNLASQVDKSDIQNDLLTSNLARCVDGLEKVSSFRSNWSDDKIQSYMESDNRGDVQDAAYETFANTISGVADDVLKSLPTTPNLCEENRKLNELLVNLANRFVSTTETIDDPLIGQLVTVTANYIAETGYTGEQTLNPNQNKKGG